MSSLVGGASRVSLSVFLLGFVWACFVGGFSCVPPFAPMIEVESNCKVKVNLCFIGMVRYICTFLKHSFNSNNNK